MWPWTCTSKWPSRSATARVRFTRAVRGVAMRLFGDSVCHATEPNINVITRCVEGVVSNSAGTAQAYCRSRPIFGAFWRISQLRSTPGSREPVSLRLPKARPRVSPRHRQARLVRPVCCTSRSWGGVAPRRNAWSCGSFFTGRFQAGTAGTIPASRRSGTYISSGSRCLSMHTQALLVLL